MPEGLRDPGDEEQDKRQGLEASMEAAAVRIDGVLAQMGTEEGLTDDSLKAALDQALAEHARAREALVALLRTPEEKMRDELLS